MVTTGVFRVVEVGSQTNRTTKQTLHNTPQPSTTLHNPPQEGLSRLWKDPRAARGHVCSGWSVTRGARCRL